MFSVPVVYSIFNRAKFVEKNLELFEKLKFYNITFVVDTGSKTDIQNLKCIRLVKRFCKLYNAKFILRKFNYGGFCNLINFYKDKDLDLKHYHTLIEDDFIITEEYLKFHDLIYKNFEQFTDYILIVPFGFNVGDKQFKMFEIYPSQIKGCLWGAGCNNKLYMPLYSKDIYQKYKLDYLDAIGLKYFEDINKKILFTSHNLLSYKGFTDSRDKDRLITCNNFPELFHANLNFDNLTLDIDNSLVKLYLEKSRFFERDCKDC